MATMRKKTAKKAPKKMSGLDKLASLTKDMPMKKGNSSPAKRAKKKAMY